MHSGYPGTQPLSAQDWMPLSSKHNILEVFWRVIVIQLYPTFRHSHFSTAPNKATETSLERKHIHDDPNQVILKFTLPIRILFCISRDWLLCIPTWKPLFGHTGRLVPAKAAPFLRQRPPITTLTTTQDPPEQKKKLWAESFLYGFVSA